MTAAYNKFVAKQTDHGSFGLPEGGFTMTTDRDPFGQFALTLLICFAVMALSACGGSSERGKQSSATAPTAEAGNLKSASVGSTVMLDGSQSTAASGSAVSYAWAFTYTPAASNAGLAGADTATPTFTPDTPGTYLVQLVVRANGIASRRDIVAVNVGSAGAVTASAAFDHTGITGNCTSCHNGTTAPTKPAGHIPTSDSCETCHATTAWTPVLTVDHNEVLGTCSSCHDNVSARGKPADHPATTQECDACHVASSWDPARTRSGTTPGTPGSSDDDDFDHAGITSGCIACHDNVIEEGKPADHIPAPDTCETCHNTDDWDEIASAPGTPGGTTDDDDDDEEEDDGVVEEEDDDDAGGEVDDFDHAGITSGCIGCHDNVTEEGKPADHIPSPDTCELCHNTEEWEPAVPGTPTSPVTPLTHAPIPPGALCGGCHNGAIATGLSPNHVPTSLDCGSCHTTSAWSPLAAASTAPPVGSARPGPGFDHSGVTPAQCAFCHNGTIATGRSANHINTTSSCAACHTTTEWAPAAFVDHNQVAGPCSSCHNGITATGKSANHPATNAECSECHARGSWQPFP